MKWPKIAYVYIRLQTFYDVFVRFNDSSHCPCEKNVYKLLLIVDIWQ